MIIQVTKCPVCEGSGKYENRKCYVCDGNGWIALGDYPKPVEPIDTGIPWGGTLVGSGTTIIDPYAVPDAPSVAEFAPLQLWIDYFKEEGW